MSKVMIDTNGKLLIEDGSILYRNFAGEMSDYNHEGDRNFNAIIDDIDVAQQMQDDGWNVKARLPRDPQDKPLHHIKVNVNFKSARGPRIYLHTGKTVQELDENTVSVLDNADILTCDMLITPYHYDRNGKKGISAYLDTLHVVLKEDPFAYKYANLED